MARLRIIHIISVMLIIMIFIVSVIFVILSGYTPLDAVIFSFMNVIGATFPPNSALLDAESPLILMTVALGIFANVVLTITFTTIFYELLGGIDLRYMLMKRKLSGLNKHAIITPINGMGLELANKLKAFGVPVVFVDNNPAMIRKAIREGMLVVHGDAENPNSLTDAHINYAIGLYALYDDDVKNTFITIEAKRMERSIRVITRIKRLEDLIKMERAGANRVMLPEAAVGIEIGDFLVTST